MFLKDLKHSVDLSQFAEYLSDLQWDSNNRVNLNHKTGHWLYDPYAVNKEWQGTPFEDLLEELGRYNIGEARLMKLDPGTCYCSHADIDDRIHLNLESNDQSYLIDLNANKMHKTSADGKLYYMDGSYVHTAANFGSSPRIQLVARVRLTKHNAPALERTELVFLNKPYDLRYNIDNSLSVLMSKLIKQKNMEFVEYADASIVLDVDTYALTLIEEELDKLQVQYRIQRGENR